MLPNGRVKGFPPAASSLCAGGNGHQVPGRNIPMPSGPASPTPQHRRACEGSDLATSIHTQA